MPPQNYIKSSHDKNLKSFEIWKTMKMWCMFKGNKYQWDHSWGLVSWGDPDTRIIHKDFKEIILSMSKQKGLESKRYKKSWKNNSILFYFYIYLLIFIILGFKLTAFHLHLQPFHSGYLRIRSYFLPRLAWNTILFYASHSWNDRQKPPHPVFFHFSFSIDLAFFLHSTCKW